MRSIALRLVVALAASSGLMASIAIYPARAAEPIALSGTLYDASDGIVHQQRDLSLTAVGTWHAASGIDTVIVQILKNGNVVSMATGRCRTGYCPPVQANYTWPTAAEPTQDYNFEVRLSTDYYGTRSFQSAGVPTTGVVSQRLFQISFVFRETDMVTALSLRRDLAFNSDAIYVNDLLNDPARNPSNEPYGTPMTAPELDELFIRNDLDYDSQIVAAYGAQHQDVFAGAWIDHTAGGMTTVGFTNQAAAQLATEQLTPLLRYPLRFRTVVRSPSYRTLRDLMERIKADSPVLYTRDAVDIASLGTASIGKVRIGVVGLTSDKTSLLLARYGPTVDTFDTTDAESLASPPPSPYAAGQRITHRAAGDQSGSMNSYVCTNGYSLFNSLGQPNPSILTALHCEYPFQDTGSVWYKGLFGNILGGSGGNFYYSEQKEKAPELLDSMRISTAGGNLSNRVLVSTRGRESARTAGVEGVGTVSVGDVACVRGFVTGETRCRMIRDVDDNERITFKDSFDGRPRYAVAKHVDCMAQFEQRSDGTEDLKHPAGKPGDSGGPVFKWADRAATKLRALGTVTSAERGTGARLCYTRIDESISNAGTQLYTITSQPPPPSGG